MEEPTVVAMVNASPGDKVFVQVPVAVIVGTSFPTRDRRVSSIEHRVETSASDIYTILKHNKIAVNPGTDLTHCTARFNYNLHTRHQNPSKNWRSRTFYSTVVRSLLPKKYH